MAKHDSFIETADGTLTLADSLTGEWYHNSAGAFAESMENYVLPAVFLLKGSFSPSRTLKLLDACFGLGYNSFSFLNHLLEINAELKSVEIHAVELDRALTSSISKVLEQDCFKVFNDSAFKDSSSGLTLQEIFERGPLENENAIEADLRSGKAGIKEIYLKLTFEDIRKFVPALNSQHIDSFDLVFHDPFSPAKFPQFWTLELFNCYRDLLVSDRGLFFTYSIAGAVRGALAISGFSIYKTRALGKKRGGCLAIADKKLRSSPVAKDDIPGDLNGLSSFANLAELSECKLFFNLDEDEIAKVLSLSGIPYRDSHLNLDRKEILKVRELEQETFKKSFKS